MIDLQGVTKTYPNGVCALDGVDLHIEKGEFVFVVGHLSLIHISEPTRP